MRRLIPRPLQQAVDETKKRDDWYRPKIAPGDRHQGAVDVYPQHPSSTRGDLIQHFLPDGTSKFS